VSLLGECDCAERPKCFVAVQLSLSRYRPAKIHKTHTIKNNAAFVVWNNATDDSPIIVGIENAHVYSMLNTPNKDIGGSFLISLIYDGMIITLITQCKMTTE
jgi:hypothetical protein